MGRGMSQEREALGTNGRMSLAPNVMSWQSRTTK